jgi:orotidine-5'-phosphate decarboxylase
MQDLKNKLIVALDVDTLEKAEYFVEKLKSEVAYFKIGSQLFTACGPEAVRMVGEKGAKAFLDLKFHDIPHTVFLAVSAGVSAPVFMMTVHTKGGREMLEAALRGAEKKAQELKIARPFIVGVTRLTSDEDRGNIQGEVLQAARMAKDAGLDGVVCAASEAAAIRKEFGENFIIVTPGIRAKNKKTDDQKRTATAAEAIAAGAHFIVVGRPILEAFDPLQALRELS